MEKTTWILDRGHLVPLMSAVSALCGSEGLSLVPRNTMALQASLEICDPKQRAEVSLEKGRLYACTSGEDFAGRTSLESVLTTFSTGIYARGIHARGYAGSLFHLGAEGVAGEIEEYMNRRKVCIGNATIYDLEIYKFGCNSLLEECHVLKKRNREKVHEMRLGSAFSGNHFKTLLAGEFKDIRGRSEVKESQLLKEGESKILDEIVDGYSKRWTAVIYENSLVDVSPLHRAAESLIRGDAKSTQCYRRAAIRFSNAIFG